jgi:hypothetical protein
MDDYRFLEIAAAFKNPAELLALPGCARGK